KPRGKSRPASADIIVLVSTTLLGASEGSSVVDASAVAPATFTNVRLVTFLLTCLCLLFFEFIAGRQRFFPVTILILHHHTRLNQPTRLHSMLMLSFRW